MLPTNDLSVRATILRTVRFSGALAFFMAAAFSLWAELFGIGIIVGWAAGAGPLIVNALFLPTWMTPGSTGRALNTKLLLLALVKWPFLAIVIFFTVKLGFWACVGFAVGLTSVYLVLAAGALMSLRSRERNGKLPRKGAQTEE